MAVATDETLRCYQRPLHVCCYLDVKLSFIFGISINLQQ